MNTCKKPKARLRNGADNVLPTETVEGTSTTPVTARGLSDILAKSLAAYVILRSKEPVSEVIGDLFEIEIEAASLVGSYFADEVKPRDLKGSLASIFSFVPIGGRKIEKDVTPKKEKALSDRSSTKKKKSRHAKK